MKKILMLGFAALAATNAQATTTNGVAINVTGIVAGAADLSVYNLAGPRIKSAFMYCTFRDSDGQRIDSVPVYVANLEPGETANQRATMSNRIIANKVDCFLESVRRD
ncbi:hypothetical protein [Mesorhizobium retamae]|uniref:DUF992 domain-containing protein n=1 Tax=Mesorhizobium retamae TaxID=2912854 RepID=A0ABS9QKB3_9HYPH|nr:hypothetical protein [Mesorhizobium sp. IRAMC:0171]MCG7507059.1 hypothetical protein [Mesorhizobium sp. IRAMC:0171]